MISVHVHYLPIVGWETGNLIWGLLSKRDHVFPASEIPGFQVSLSAGGGPGYSSIALCMK